MTSVEDPAVRRLLEGRNHAVVSTLDPDGSVHSTVVWVDLEDGRLALNSAVGRRWPSNLDRDDRVTVVVYDQRNPYEYVEVRGRARRRLSGADAHIDRLARKYLRVDSYPRRRPGEQRVTYLVEAERVRHRRAV